VRADGECDNRPKDPTDPKDSDDPPRSDPESDEVEPVLRSLSGSWCFEDRILGNRFEMKFETVIPPLDFVGLSRRLLKFSVSRDLCKRSGDGFLSGEGIPLRYLFPSAERGEDRGEAKSDGVIGFVLGLGEAGRCERRDGEECKLARAWGLRLTPTGGWSRSLLTAASRLRG